MRTLKLTLKRQWYDLIKSGAKKEEYREIKPYWIGRLFTFDDHFDCDCICEIHADMQNINKHFDSINQMMNFFDCKYSEFNFIQFTNGYSANSPRITVECKGMRIGTGRPEWGAVEGVNYFVIELGDVLTSNEAETK